LAVAEGDCYRVNVGATGDWSGHDDEIAIRVGGAWHFVAPFTGMVVFDRTAGKSLRFDSMWQSADAPEMPSGGTTIDAEVRSALSELIQALRNVGIFGPAA
jgi:hypothetical protein